MGKVRSIKLNLQKFKALFILVTAVLALFAVSPVLQRVLVYPQTEFFTEMSMLGPAHSAQNYPYGIALNQSYTVYLDLTDHLGSCAYYQIEVKFRNATESAPNSLNSTYSTLSSLYNFSAFVADKQSFESRVSFGINYYLTNANQVQFNNITVNGVSLNLQGLSSNWDSNNNVFYGNLVFELWIYNGSVGSFQYNDRFVDLKLNMTSTGD